MKMGWQVSTREPEAYFYEKAAGVKGLPDIRCSGTVVPSLREGVRRRLEKVLPSNKPDKKSNRKPGKKPNKKPDRKLPADRSLRVLIMTERYYPLTEAKSPLHDPKMLLDVMKSLLSGSSSENDIIYIRYRLTHYTVHQSLFERGVLHRDINPFNLMRTSEYTGRLIDLDLSSVCDEKARHDPEDVPLHDPEDIPLTFSIPFLALDLLRAPMPQRHLYRHDLESFYWSFVWIVLDHVQFEDPEFSLESWRKGAQKMIARAKRGFFECRTHRRVFSKLSHDFPSYKPIYDCLQKLTRLMASAYHADSDTGSDSELDSSQSDPGFGGSYVGRERISYEAFLDIFP